MNLALSNGETIVKSWNYGKLKGWFLTKGNFTLTVTNKKLVSTYECKNEVTRTDYDLNSIKGLCVAYEMKRRFLFFKRGALSISFTTPVFDEVSIVGLSSIGNKRSFLSRIPIIGWFFGGGKKKVKVDVSAAKDIVENLSALIINTANAGV